MNRNFFMAALVLAALSSSSFADNWGHWRGPTGNSVAINANPPTQFSGTENVKWKVPIAGKGSGSPVIWEDKVFVVTAVPAGVGAPSGSLPTLQFKLLAFSRADGKLLWESIATTSTPHQGTHSTNGFASASPCTDGQHVYAHFGSRGLFCYTMDGQLVWKRDDLGLMTTRNGFGEGSSPTLADNLILVPWDHEGASFLYAIDKTTGKDVWKTPRDEPTCWATPLVVDNNGSKQVVMNGQTSARSYDLATGKELWRCGGQTQRPCATPVAANGLVFVGSGFRGSFLGAFSLTGRGNIEGSGNVVWSIGRDTPDVSSPLLSNGRLYFYKGKTGQLTCVDAATGRPYYTAVRINGINSTYASPVAAGGKIFLTDRSGTIAVIEDSPQLKVLATNSVGEPVDATPAPAGNELFIRGQFHLFCIAQK